MKKLIVLAAAGLLLAACQSDSQRDRALVGGGLGAATGAVIGSAIDGGGAGGAYGTRKLMRKAKEEKIARVSEERALQLDEQRSQIVDNLKNVLRAEMKDLVDGVREASGVEKTEQGS